MPTYRYKCLDCGNKFDRYNVAVENRDQVHPECPECASGNSKHIMADRLNWSITETNDPVSAKQDAYWAGAERKRLVDKRKRDADKKEVEFYDSEHKKKQETIAARNETIAAEDAAENEQR